MPPDLSTFFVATAARTVEAAAAVITPDIADRLFVEGLISLVQAASLLPPIRGQRVSASSIFRWITRGKLGIRLEGIKCHGTGYYTSRQAMARFAAALTLREQGSG